VVPRKPKHEAELETDVQAYRRDVLPVSKKERESQLRQLAEFSRDPMPLATLAAAAGRRSGQSIVEFVCSLEFQAQSPSEAKFLHTLLAVVASGNDAREMLGIEKAKTGHRRTLLHLRFAAHEIETRQAEGDGLQQSISDVAEITGDDPGNLRRAYFRSKQQDPEAFQGYGLLRAMLGTDDPVM